MLNAAAKSRPILLGNGDGAFSAKTAVSNPLPSAAAAAVGDLNHDGIPDLITS